MAPAIARPRRADASVAAWKASLRRLRASSRWGSKLIRITAGTSASPDRKRSNRWALHAPFFAFDGISDLHAVKRVDCVANEAGVLGHCFGQSGQGCRSPCQQDVVYAVVRGAGKKELQCPANFLRHAVDEQVQHGRLIIFGQFSTALLAL